MVTRNDVACRAKVSPAVVSYVINESNYVSPEKREAVLKAMEELGYIPNRTARSLKVNKTYQIAVLRGNPLNDMFNDLLYEMETIAYRHGYTVSLITVMRDENMVAKDSFIADLISRRFDAIFVANSSLMEAQINRLAFYGIAVLLYNTRDYVGLAPGICCLAPDYRRGVRQLIELLIDNGHTRIGFVPNSFYPSTDARANHRYDAYANALESRGIPVDPTYVAKMTPSIDKMVEDTMAFFDSSRSVPPPTALYADESVVAGSLMRGLRDRGIRVPEDVSIVCSSDSTISRILTPKLTSVGVSPRTLAEEAIQAILQLMDGQTPESKLMEMTLFQRDSVRSIK